MPRIQETGLLRHNAEANALTDQTGGASEGAAMARAAPDEAAKARVTQDTTTMAVNEPSTDSWEAHERERPSLQKGTPVSGPTQDTDAGPYPTSLAITTQGAGAMHPGVVSLPGRTYLAAATTRMPEPSAARMDKLIRERLAAILPNAGTPLEAIVEGAIEQCVMRAMQ